MNRKKKRNDKISGRCNFTFLIIIGLISFGFFTMFQSASATSPVIEVVKIATPDYVDVGSSNLVYTIWINNTGDAVATNVTIIDDYDELVIDYLLIWINNSWVLSTEADGFIDDPNNGTLIWNISLLNPNESAMYTIRAGIKFNITEGTIFNNSVLVTCDEGVSSSDMVATIIGSSPSYEKHFIQGTAYYDGTVPADGANVTVVNERTGEKLYDVVGLSGNSGVSAYYMVDLSELPSGYRDGDIINVTIRGIDTYAYWIGNNLTTVNNETVWQAVNVILTKDSVPPTTIKKIGKPSYNSGNWITTSTPIWLNATDNFPGLKATYYRIWNGSWHPNASDDEYCGNHNITSNGTAWWYVYYNDTVNFGPIYFHEECTHHLMYYSVDNAGNNETMHNQTHYVDDTPPESHEDVGIPSYDKDGDGINEWVTTSTPIWINATENLTNGQLCDVGAHYIWYRIWRDTDNDGTPDTYQQWLIQDNSIDDLDQTFGNISIMFTFDEECVHWFNWSVIDYLGNNETMHNQTHYVDDTPPTHSMIIGGPKYIINSTFYINSSTPIWINATDAGLCRVNNYTIHWVIWNSTGIYMEGNLHNNVTLHITENYTYTIGYWVEDILGNRDPAVGYRNTTVYVDNIPPLIDIIVGEPYWPECYIRNTTAITINSSDGEGIGIDILRYRIWYEGEWSGWYNYTENFTLIGEGEHYLEVEAVDKFGNKNDIIKQFYVDDVAPTTTVKISPVEPNGLNGWYISNVTVTLLSDDDGCGVNKTYYKINNEEWVEYIHPFSISEDGAHSVYYYTIDNLGNGEEIKVISVKIDKTPPSIKVTGPSGKIETTTVTFSWDASDELSGIDGYYYKIDGSWIPTSETSKSFILTDGSYTFMVKAVDKAGNSNTASRSFNIVTNKSPIANFSYTPSSPTDLDTITFVDHSYDPDGNIVNWTWDFGDGNISYEKNPKHRYADNGTYIVSLVVKDNKGAASIAKVVAINVANEPPVAIISYIPKIPTIGKIITFKSLSFDKDGSIVNWTWDFGDGNITYGSIVNHTYNKKGNYTVKLTIVDNDGAINETIIHIVIKKEIQNIWLPLTIIVILIIIAIALFAIWKKRIKK